jgi:hypothetical protein
MGLEVPMNLCIADFTCAGRAFFGIFRRETNMSNQPLRQAQGRPRVARVLVVLLVSMTTGAVVLMALGNHPPSAGAFCLSTYYRLDPVGQAIYSRATQAPGRWECVEVYYSGTKAGNVEQIASLSGLPSSDDINCHFVICNGLGGSDGEIQTTEKWQNQWSVIPDHTWYGSSRTIRVCLVADGKSVRPSDFQIKRTESIVEALSAKFSVPPTKIFYPTNWR